MEPKDISAKIVGGSSQLGAQVPRTVERPWVCVECYSVAVKVRGGICGECLLDLVRGEERRIEERRLSQ